MLWKPTSSVRRQALTWNSQGKKKRDRPKKSWRHDLMADIDVERDNLGGHDRRH